MAEVEIEGRIDVKRLSKPRFDPSLSQQKRRELLLDWQKTRRDELVDKFRSLEDSAASESEGEDIDFLDEVDFKGRPLKTNNDLVLPPIVEITDENIAEAETEVINVAQGHGRGRGRGRMLTTSPASTLPSLIPDAKGDRASNAAGLGRGRGRGTFQKKASIADSDLNWREKKEPVPKIVETSKTDVKNKSKSRVYRRRRPAPYGLMLSEWLVDIPEDFEKNWVGVLCPVGKRCVVVACRGRTRVYTRRNDYLGQFSSCLPGGSNAHENNLSGTGRRGLTILDCLWSDKAQKFYVLDLVCWNSYSVNNCATDFRHFFLTSKFFETPELLESSTKNIVPFVPLPYFPAAELSHIMTTAYPIFPDEVDGVIFYLKNAFYVADTTPLALWIHLSDMETVLSINVSPELLGRERVRHEKARYYLEKPDYSKKKKRESLGATTSTSMEETEGDVDLDEPCDENGLPLG